jgi:hypothetical protein
MIVLKEREKEENRWMIVITELTANLPGNRSGRAGLKEGADVAVESDHRGRNRAQCTEERKDDTPLGYSG